MTEYVLLVRERDHDSWTPLRDAETGETAVVKAHSPRAAIRASVDLQDSVFVAIPARSWKPVTVKVETKTALRFS